VVKISLNQGAHFARAIDKCYVISAARNRFNANRPRTGAQIKKPRACNSWGQDIEECLAQAI